ncbi:MAG TPA: hypothetical protein DHW22_05715 [Planctomycetaceae bacterium]|nr:hypothetical protein [Planctomycetaceae bacterium]|tara:strand:+ start:733 stop:1080 length:348 start_codon:yes stop_codon:yes gene_type:complete
MWEGTPMVAPRRRKRIFCTVVRVPATENTSMSTHQRFSTKPSDLIPWADPYIAQLVTKLQKEVRNERFGFTESIRKDDLPDRSKALAAELEPPGPGIEFEGDWHEEPRWTFSDEF